MHPACKGNASTCRVCRHGSRPESRRRRRALQEHPPVRQQFQLLGGWLLRARRPTAQRRPAHSWASS
eukprot:6789363-Heterocapsa_arctica.AAC.1